MKKITIVWCILLTSYVCNAQNWQWAKQMGSNYLLYDDFNLQQSEKVEILLIDAFGNI